MVEGSRFDPCWCLGSHTTIRTWYRFKDHSKMGYKHIQTYVWYAALALTLTWSVCTEQRASLHSQEDEPSTRLLQRRAQEWVEFNQWRAYVERRVNR